MMLELKERTFAQLNALGAEEVRARLARGEQLGDMQLVREWLALPESERTQMPVASAINARQRV